MFYMCACYVHNTAAGLSDSALLPSHSAACNSCLDNDGSCVGMHVQLAVLAVGGMGDSACFTTVVAAVSGKCSARTNNLALGAG
jgi:hypothetical protein